MSASAGPRRAAAPARRRITRADAGLIAAGAGLTVLFAAALTRRPLEALALLVVFAMVALVLLNRQRLARMDVGALLVVGLVVLPAAALLGPSFAMPSFPQAFLFRIVLALVIAVGATYLVVRRAPLPFAAKDVALPIMLWFAWLLIAFTWSADKASALSYVMIVVTMMALLLATAAAGGSRRRLRWLGYSLL